MASIARKVLRIVYSSEMSEGMGARVRRSIGKQGIEQLDPFLLLDEGKVKLPNGFPDHPHRGFETVTYVLKGAVRHEDFLGNEGIIKKGDLQWMTAGRGIVHSEMPHGPEEAWVVQLWVNLPKSLKMCPPRYQELSCEDIPKRSENGVSVSVLAGESMGCKTTVATHTPIMYLDFTLETGSSHLQDVPSGWSAFIYVLEGSVNVDNTKVKSHNTAVLEDGDFIKISNNGPETCRLLLVAGQPIKEPVYRSGPFVLATKHDLRMTMTDYENCRNGFENAREWRSQNYR